MESVDVSDLAFLCSNPARVTASLRFQFQKSVDVVCEEAAFTRFWIVPRDCIRRLPEFPKFYILCLRPIAPRLIPTCLPSISRRRCDDDNRSWCSILGHMFGTGRITVSWRICTVGRGGRGPGGGTILHFIRPSIFRQTSISAHASPT